MVVSYLKHRMHLLWKKNTFKSKQGCNIFIWFQKCLERQKAGELGGLQNTLGMHNDEWHKERGLVRIENMCFAFNEKHSHAG